MADSQLGKPFANRFLDGEKAVNVVNWALTFKVEFWWIFFADLPGER